MPKEVHDSWKHYFALDFARIGTGKRLPLPVLVPQAKLVLAARMAPTTPPTATPSRADVPAVIHILPENILTTLGRAHTLKPTLVRR